MEPVTHILTGACLARTGLNRKAAYATLAMAVGAEFPDIDTLWGLRGPVEAFQHHRGITHTFLGVPFEAALIVAAVYGWHRWRAMRRHRATPVQTPGDASAAGPVLKPLTAAPVRWGLLYGFTLLALLSHLWLDYTNNYGLRPFFPFNPRWYAASITFIFDPLMFALLVCALLLPALFRLVSAEIGARQQRFVAPGWAILALVLVSALWGVRFFEHGQAQALASQQSYSLTRTADSAAVDPAVSDAPVAPVLLSAQRVLSSPDPVNPFRWYSVTDFGPLYQLGTVNLRVGTYVPEQGIEPKLNPSPALTAAERTPLGRAYLDWSSMPFLDMVGAPQAILSSEEDAGPVATVVTFRDPRFLGASPWLHRMRTRTPLTGEVQLDPSDHVVGQSMDGKPER